MMATSRVEIPAPSPFGCTAVHNRRDNNPTHHKKKWAKAREMVLSVDHGPTRGPNRRLSFEVSDLGSVSSLVQKWKDFAAMRSPNNNTSTKNNTSQDNIEPPTPTPTIDPALNDWESDSTDVSGPPSSRSVDSDAKDVERVRVADIIRKWKDNDVVCVKTANSSEHRCFSPAGISSPRIRGRQAFNDVLMQIERSKNKELQGLLERKPVSNFAHRGLIQALLRKRVVVATQNGSVCSEFCQRELMDNDTRTTQNACVANKQGNENRCNEVDNSLMSCPEIRMDTIQDSEVPVTPRQHDVSQRSRKVNEDTQKSGRLSHRYESLGCEKNPFSILIRLEDNSLSQPATSAEADASLHNTEINSRKINESPCTNVWHKEEDDANHHKVTKSNYDSTVNECEKLSSYHEDKPGSSQNLVDTTSMYWVSEGVSSPEVEWEEQQSDNQERNNTEWIDEVSRPCSDWEDLRQARYKEMLDPFSEKEEIRVLLGRRSVSTFLSSDLRDKIDQVIASRPQGPQTPKNGRVREENNVIRLSGQAVIISDKQEEEEKEEEGEFEQDEGQEDYNDNFDEYEEADISARQQQYNESDDYTDQITTSPPESWSHNQLGSDYSYLAGSHSTQQSSPNYYSQNSRPISSDSARPAIDIELIYELRGHMQQLHQEMSELRKSIQCCVDMQIDLRRSIKKEVAAALHHSEAKKYGRRNSVKKVTTAREKCCVCYKMQVDTLLYRCGHMCTCFKCAHKLQWSSGKCPICRAPILDVVRTYTNHS